MGVSEDDWKDLLRPYKRLLEEYAVALADPGAESEAQRLQRLLTKEMARVEAEVDEHDWGYSVRTLTMRDTFNDASVAAFYRINRRELNDTVTMIAKYQGVPELERFLRPLRDRKDFLEDESVKFEESLRLRGAPIPAVSDNTASSHVQRLVEPIATRIQLKIALKKKFDELKQQTPAELHSDLEKAFRQAMEQLDKQ